MISAKSKLRVTIGLIGLLLGYVCGCTSVNLVDWKRFRVPKASAKDPVSRIVCIWEAAEGQGLDGKPTRGFAGQILFFTHGKASPVGVDGDVTIDVFDGPSDTTELPDPIHRFEFMGDAWTIHLTDSVLGPSYNVFVPYTLKHARRAHCGLRVELKAKHGTKTYSEIVHVTLPGRVNSEPQHISPQQRDLPINTRPEAEAIKIGAALRNSRVTPTVHEANLSSKKLQASATNSMAQAGLVAPRGGGKGQDQRYDENLQRIETMLNELKQQHEQRDLASEPAATDHPGGRRFQLRPVGEPIDRSPL